MTPTALSLRHLRGEGWTVDVCERWVPAGVGQVRKDLFGMLDLVALRDTVTMGVQTTSHGNALSRHKKIVDDEHAERLAALHAANWIVVVHGWRKSTRDGHACPHDKPRCGCIWTLHRLIQLTPQEAT
jgi:hypothetical protein